MAKGSSKSNNQSRKLTRDQKAARIKAAEERQLRQQAEKERKDRLKKIGIIAVCVILVLALSLPTMALSVLGG